MAVLPITEYVGQSTSPYGGAESFRIWKWHNNVLSQNLKMPEYESVWIWMCQNLSVRIMLLAQTWKCQNIKVSESQSFGILKCQNCLKYECARIHGWHNN